MNLLLRDDVKNAEMRKTSLQSLLPDIPPRFEIAKVAESRCLLPEHPWVAIDIYLTNKCGHISPVHSISLKSLNI